MKIIKETDKYIFTDYFSFAEWELQNMPHSLNHSDEFNLNLPVWNGKMIYRVRDEKQIEEILNDKGSI